MNNIFKKSLSFVLLVALLLNIAPLYAFAADNPVPVISAINPDYCVMGGPAFTLTVNGDNFLPDSVVRVNGYDTFTTYVSSTQLSTIVPAALIAASGTITVTVFNPAPGGGTSNAVDNPVIPAAIISSLNPVTCIVGGPAFTLTINGYSFMSDSVVRINGEDRITTFISNTQLSTVISASETASVGVITVTVFNSEPINNVSNAVNFEIILAPAITDITPDSCLAGGPSFPLNVNGYNFMPDSVVRINGYDMNTAFVRSTQLSAIVPAALIAASGTIPVAVFNPEPGGGISSTVNLTIIPTPVISGINPDSCREGQHAFTITVNGDNFLPDSVVRVNGNNRTTAFINSNSLTASILASDVASDGALSLTVFNPAPGGGTSNGVTFTVMPKIVANASGNTETTKPSATVKTDMGTSYPSVISTTTAEAKSDSNGNAVAAVTESQVEEAVSKAVEAAAKQGEGTVAKVEIILTAPAEAKTVEARLPKAAVTALENNKINSLTVATPVADMTFDQAAIFTISKESAADVKITASEVNAASLSEAEKAAVSDRPVFDFSVTSRDKTISQFGGNVSVSVPYTPKTGEDTNAIVIYYINAEGKAEVVSNCWYDAATGKVGFTTDHFSRYSVGYNKAIFTDVAADAWYGNAVTFLAARGITAGTGNGKFSPEDKLTRGQFLVMAMKAYGIKPDETLKDNFTDAGSTYYSGFLAAAKRLRITSGVGGNKYAPVQEITCQEMITLLHNIIKLVGELPAGITEKGLTEFDDADQVAPWAKDAMTLFVKTGTVSGNGGKLAPESTTTRAEMAQVLYNLLSR